VWGNEHLGEEHPLMGTEPVDSHPSLVVGRAHTQMPKSTDV
jgi:hypothetical protein